VSIDRQAKKPIRNYRFGPGGLEESRRKPMVFANKVKKSNRIDFG
jgi:hypothetical protein